MSPLSFPSTFRSATHPMARRLMLGKMAAQISISIFHFALPGATTMKSILALAALSLAATSANAAGVKNLCSKGQINEVECHHAKGRAGYTVEILNCKGEG